MNSKRQAFIVALVMGLVLVGTLLFGLDISAQAQEPGTLQIPSTKIEGLSSQQLFTPTWATERVDAEKTFSTMSDRSAALDSADHLHVAYGLDHLYYAHDDGSMWHWETVDPAWGVGAGTSLALDSDGNPHISYHDDLHNDLKYAYYDGTQWHIQTVDSDGDVGIYTSIAVDDNDHPHIGYYDGTHDAIKYAHYDGSSWRVESVDQNAWVYVHLSLAVDTNGRPHIGYARSKWPDPGELGYAYWTGSTWMTETVARGSSVGQYVSLALDSHGRPHMSYLDGSKQDLMYANWTGSQWITKTVENNVGWAYVKSSLALDTSDNPHIAYSNITNGVYLTYAYWTGDAWAIETLNSGERIFQKSLALDTNGHPHIAYQGSDGALEHIFWTGSLWSTESIDRGRYWGTYASLALASTAPYTPHISYAGNDGLRHAYYDGAAWSIETVDNVYIGSGTALAIAPTVPYTPYISYYDYDGSAVKYARWSPEGWSTETIGDFGVMGYGIALALAPTTPYTPHIAYIADGNLKHAYWIGHSWAIEIVDYGYPDPFEQLDSPSLALASTAPYTPYISYHDRDYGDLRYAYKVGSGWITETVAYVGNGSGFTSLVVDTLAKPHIAYSGGYMHAVKYAYQVGGLWVAEIVDTDVNADISLALDVSLRPYISYPKSGLQYASRDGSAWLTETVDSLGNVGGYASLALDEGARPRIAYYDGSNGDLKFAWRERVDIVPTSGGLVGAYGSANFDFPAGAFTDTVVFTYTVLQPSGTLPHVGVFFDINAVYAGSGDTAQIVPGQTYTVVVHYDEANVPAGVDEADLALYYWDNLSSDWVKEPTSVVDTVNNTITATPDHFSVWAGLFEIAPSVTKSVMPTGAVNYGDLLTYTVAISGMPGTEVGVYDPLTGTMFVSFVEQPAGIEYADHAITGTASIPATVSFVVRVGVPGTVGWVVDVTNRACVYPTGGTLNDCVWSDTVTNQASRPYQIYLPLVMRDH